MRVGRSQVGVSGVPISKLPEGGPHTGNSLMRDAGVDEEVRMRKVGHAGKDIDDRYTHVLIEAHLAAAEQTAALVRGSREGNTMTVCVHSASVRCRKRTRYAVTGARNGRILPGQAWWGGWGSNPRPADYEKYGLMHYPC
jgi:hypothetical protein